MIDKEQEAVWDRLVAALARIAMAQERIAAALEGQSVAGGATPSQPSQNADRDARIRQGIADALAVFGGADLAVQLAETYADADGGGAAGA